MYLSGFLIKAELRGLGQVYSIAQVQGMVSDANSHLLGESSVPTSVLQVLPTEASGQLLDRCVAPIAFLQLGTLRHRNGNYLPLGSVDRTANRQQSWDRDPRGSGPRVRDSEVVSTNSVLSCHPKE